MPRHVQCMVCRRMLSAHRTSKPYGKLAVDYAYCERCYHEEVGELEATIASYRAASNRYKEAQGKYWLHDHARQVEFLASGWKLGPQPHESFPDLACNHEFQHTIPACPKDLFFSDVLLVPADGLPVPAHKAVLAGKSRVFRAMFCTCPMREAMSGVVMMEDMGGETLASFVGFLYTARIAVELMEKQAVELLNAAEKYDVALLRALCEDAIANKIGPHNAIGTLELARKYGSQVIRAAVLDFVSKDVEQLPVFEEYQAYATKDPALLLDLYEDLAGQWMLIDSASHKRSRSCKLVPGD